MAQDLFVWFRETFPYYYDACTACDCESESGGNEFVGFTAPSAEEKHFGRASRVELYSCALCGAITRFARCVVCVGFEGV